MFTTFDLCSVGGSDDIATDGTDPIVALRHEGGSWIGSGRSCCTWLAVFLSTCMAIRAASILGSLKSNPRQSLQETNGTVSFQVNTSAVTLSSQFNFGDMKVCINHLAQGHSTGKLLRDGLKHAYQEVPKPES